MELKLLHKFFDGRTTPDEEGLIREWVGESPENERIFLKERWVFDRILLSNFMRIFFLYIFF